MKQTFTTTVTLAMFILAFVSASCLQTKAQTVEKLIIYENFGGTDAGSSVAGIQPDKWPDVHSDSGKYCGWYATDQNLDNKGNTVSVPQFYGNGFFHIDSVQVNRTGGLSGLDITVDDLTKIWSKAVPFRNGYLMPITNATTLDFGFFGAAALPELLSWISYAPYTPDYLKNQTDEQGYIYLGKNFGDERAVFTIPSSDIEYLKDISRIELLVSGSRVGHNNTISVRIEELDVDGMTLGVDTFTFSATIEPRLIYVPVDKDYCRIYIQAWGSANNANVTDFALMTSNTEVDTRTAYNYNAIAGIKPDGSSTTGQTANPGMSIHMIKIYAMMAGTGYTITTDDGLVTGTKTGIAYGQNVQLTAQATSGANGFMGWKIAGKPDLSEVANPLTVTVTSDMTIMPVYAGDEVEVAVVNENFTDWVQRGITQEAYNNRLEYSNTPNETVWTGKIRVPLRYGFTSGGKDSVDISLDKCNVIPQYGLRVYNLPGSEKYTGYVAFMGPNDAKGYVIVDSLDGITKAEADISSYDLPVPDRACALLVNDSIVRNKTLRTLYAERVVVDNNPVNPFSLQVGPGNQARCEYLEPASPTADIFTSVSAAAVALHNLKMYAKINMPDLNYYQLTLPAVPGGTVSGYSPDPGNSTNHYLEGTDVTVMALPDPGFGFEGWVDETETTVGLDNPITITMDAGKTLKPVFSQKPSYIKLVPNTKGEVTTSIEPQSVSNDTLTFLAGISVSLTATPVYGYTFAKWTKNGEDVTDNPLLLSVTDMGKFVTNVIEVVYDSVTARNTLSVTIDTSMGDITFDHTPENVTYVGITLGCEFPAGETIEVEAEPGYGYSFSNWQSGLDIADADTLSNPVSVTMDGNKTIGTVWSPLSRCKLIIEDVPNGSLVVTDIHKDGELEQQGLWPEGYNVELTIQPDEEWMFFGLNAGVTYTSLSKSVLTVRMDQDTVRVIAEFTEFIDITQITEIFQDPDRWPEPEGNVSNVPGAIEFLSLAEDWDPTTYNDDLESLLNLLAYYREWGSQSNDNSDGPSGTKNPMTTLVLNYESTPLVRKIRVGSSPDSVKLTAVKYSLCNNCLIAKAVKASNVTNRYLGHVTPGMIALWKPNVVIRSVNDYPAFMPGDSLGMLMVEGLAYVDRLEIGYVTSSAQFSPGVFYTTDPIELIDENGLFGASFGDLWSIGQLSGKEISLRPDQGDYGWGCAQEGMIMDQNMYIAEEDVPETKILITAGYKQGDPDYVYSNIYIHDLRIWGSPMVTTGVKDMMADADDECRFYMLGNTDILQIDVDEPVKALVIYDMSGQAVKVIREVEDNKVSLAGLKPGVYAVHSYVRSGRMYTGSFGKAY
ncbi:MAG: T9SS type A sorting domain-containing protein [Bacteroidales bacterium]|nr:T9SS type A sorting domain-containing protein [Bacteroidales bacterium]